MSMVKPDAVLLQQWDTVCAQLLQEFGEATFSSWLKPPVHCDQP